MNVGDIFDVYPRDNGYASTRLIVGFIGPNTVHLVGDDPGHKVVGEDLKPGKPKNFHDMSAEEIGNYLIDHVSGYTRGELFAVSLYSKDSRQWKMIIRYREQKG